MYSQSKPDLYEQVTASIVQAIEAGTSTYQMPWHRIRTAINAFTRKAYRGVNVLALWAAAARRGFSSPEWATYPQWADSGAQVRRGEKSTMIIFWKLYGAHDGDNTEEEQSERENSFRCFARAYHVFNANQVDNYEPGTPALPELNSEQRIQTADAFFQALPGEVQFGGDVAAFIPALDLIRMPAFEQVNSPEAYVSVYAHERVHWTGAKQRLNRDLSGRFGSESYAMEELCAELGSAFVCASLGIRSEPRTDHAPYINSWLRVLNGDQRAIFTAASKAQEAADYLQQLVSLSHEKAS
jgi:antirestriction protein ArdC